MNEIQAVESMRLFDPTIHMDITFPARMPLDDSSRIDDCKLRLVRPDGQIVAGNDTDDGEESSGGLPALGAAAGMIVGDVALKAHHNLVRGTATVQSTAGEIGVSLG